MNIRQPPQIDVLNPGKRICSVCGFFNETAAFCPTCLDRNQHCWRGEWRRCRHAEGAFDDGCNLCVPMSHAVLQPQAAEVAWDDAEDDFAAQLRRLGFVETPISPPPPRPPTGASAAVDPDYRALWDVLMDAYDQAREGKGKERHAAKGQAFQDQQIVQISEWLGSNHGDIFQAVKKSIESVRLPKERARAELLGAINYLAAAVIVLERSAS